MAIAKPSKVCVRAKIVKKVTPRRIRARKTTIARAFPSATTGRLTSAASRFCSNVSMVL